MTTQSTSLSGTGETPLWIVIEDAYGSPVVNGQKYVHTVAAETESGACERVAEAIRGRMDGEGRKLLDAGVVLSVFSWESVATITAKDKLELTY